MKKNGLIILTLIIGSVVFLNFKANQKQQKENRQESSIDKSVNVSIRKHAQAIKKAKETVSTNQKAIEASKKKRQKISFLNGYKKLSPLILMTPDQRIQRQAMLQDEKMLRKSYLYLKKNDSSGKRADRLVNTMKVIDFLKESMSWDKNPNRESAIIKTRYFLLNDILDKPQSDNQLRASAVDKAELYLALRESAPEQAAEVRNLAKGTKLMAVIEFAETNI